MIPLSLSLGEVDGYCAAAPGAPVSSHAAHSTERDRMAAQYDRTGMLSDAIQGNAYGNCPACQTTGASNAVEAPDTAQEAPLVSTMYICILTNSLIHVNVKRFTFYVLHVRFT